MDPKDQERWQALALEAGRVFTPNTPIDAKSLFTGRVAQIRRVVDVIRQSGQHAIVIIDEFDRLPEKARRAFADTIKTLSDHAVPSTVVLVGVADSVEQLVEEHQSVSRALVQIQMPRMTPQEIGTIIDSGLNRLEM